MNVCIKCGDPAPDRKKYCWCCSHTKLHPMEDTRGCDKHKIVSGEKEKKK